MKDVMEIGSDAFDRAGPGEAGAALIAVPRDAELEDALARMRQHGAHVALSVDRDGVTRGVLFVEDAIEVLVGEINDATAA